MLAWRENPRSPLKLVDVPVQVFLTHSVYRLDEALNVHLPQALDRVRVRARNRVHKVERVVDPAVSVVHTGQRCVVAQRVNAGATLSHVGGELVGVNTSSVYHRHHTISSEVDEQYVEWTEDVRQSLSVFHD